MVDLSFLEKFTKGNTEKMKRYIGIYLSIAPETFEKMNQNLAEEDWEQLRINAHSLKPQADYMGIADLKSILINIESSIENGSFETLKDLFSKAKSIHVDSETELKTIIERL